ncbi:adenosine deaminase family protein [Streptomyces himalayensis]|uniref:Adenosine deaminase family protein n=1 Tax=Streptomyces himalayensis subsp. himalayensis TaxID=2756131 RepID=A0A7W0DW91_9ACTN|nr:adenosine deaminase family protein [Streptomyces himalayensis]MBA2951579.1 adenosine deaminase family protein [Streptomyces himalayensis subsp. himalayensis]
MRSLARLPKAHLHLHLEGAMRPATLAELAGERGEQPPDSGGFKSFEDFMPLYRVAARLVREGPRENLLRLVREVVEDAAADGAVWIEPHVNPLTYEDDPDAALELLDAVIDEGRRTAARLGIGFGVLVFARRNADPSEAVETARLAARRADNGVVSFGLAGDEAHYAPEPFAEAFAIARDAGLISAPHAGELAGPASVRAALDVLDARRIAHGVRAVGELAGPASVRAALDVLDARRIAHGVRAVEDPALVARLAAESVVLDVCPTSNVALGVVESLSVHPLPLLLQAGVRCTLNADDPLLFGPGLLEEYETARATFALTDPQIAAIARTSVESSGAPRALVEDAVRLIGDWLDIPDQATAPPIQGRGDCRTRG